jgi:hypothetical protein
MRSGYVDDPHFNTQNSFITPWPQPDYFINLDDIQKTGHGQI